MEKGIRYDRKELKMKLKTDKNGKVVLPLKQEYEIIVEQLKKIIEETERNL